MAEAAKQESDAPLKTDVESRGHVYESILETIGNTPLVRVPKFSEKYRLEADVMAKLEFFNPASSVKDRIGFAMIEAAERAGRITPGKTVIVEPTSGNTGIGLAMVAAAKGYKLILTMPESMSIERRKMLKLYGAELHLTPAEKGIHAAIEKAEKLAGQYDDSFIPGQFENPANPQIHQETTGIEIWNDTHGECDILVAGVGTGGTLSGTSRFLKSKKPSIKTYAVEPEESQVIAGGEHSPHKIQGIGTGMIPDNLDREMVDATVAVNSDEALETAREVTRLEGIPCGISSGAAMAAAKKVALMPENKGKKIVVMLASSADRYISTPLFDDLD